MFSKFSEEAQKILLTAKKEMSNLHHPYVGSEHLLLAILSNTNLDVTKKLNEYNINYKKFKEEIIKIIGKGTITNNWFLYTPLLKRIIENATVDSRENSDKEVSVYQLFISLLEEGDGVAIRILMGMNIDIDLLYEEFTSNNFIKKSKNKHKLMIEDYAIDLNHKCLNSEIDPVIGRDEEIERVIEILSRRSKNNPLLIGPAGVGKTSIVEALANRIIMNMVPKNLKNKRILSISMASLVAGTKYRGEFEERINKLIKEVEEDKNVILFIDEIHTLVGAGGAEGAIDASNILKPALARGKLQLIGATTTDEYTTFLEKDKALDRRFQKVNISEPSVLKTIEILTKIKSIYESFHNTKISDEIIEYIVKLSDKYIHNRTFPDKAIDILDEVCAKTSLLESPEEKKMFHLNQKLNTIIKLKKEQIIKENFEEATNLKKKQFNIESKINKLQLKQVKLNLKEITKEMVDDVISNKVNIPINSFNLNNKDILNLERSLNSKVKGQNDSIKIIVDYTKRKQLGFADNKVHSFLLVGKSGVGKTMLVKEYASNIYNDNNFIRVDMSEFKEPHSVSKIIGSPPGYIGYDDHNNLLEKIRNNPYSLLLLDEIEKADSSVLKLFLQILDEGKIKDSRGNIVWFNNVIIFMTSNVGTNNLKIGFDSSNDSKVINKLNLYFGTEFINRVDDILIFNSLDKEDISNIIKDKLKKLKKFYLNRDIQLSFSKKIVTEIQSEIDYEKYGARRIDKVIDKKINNYIINEILNGKEVIKIPELL